MLCFFFKSGGRDVWRQKFAASSVLIAISQQPLMIQPWNFTHRMYRRWPFIISTQFCSILIRNVCFIVFFSRWAIFCVLDHASPVAMERPKLCLAELGYSSLIARVQSAQKKFVMRLVEERKYMEDDPFICIWKICCENGTRASKYLQDVLAIDDPITADRNRRRELISSFTHRTRLRNYININKQARTQ